MYEINGFNESNFPQAFRQAHMHETEPEDLTGLFDPIQPVPLPEPIFKTYPSDKDFEVEALDLLHKVLEATHKCDKCGVSALNAQVFAEPYTGGRYFVCATHDEQLFDLLDRGWHGVPECGYDPNTIDGMYAQLIVDAYFSKPKLEV